MGSGFTHRGNIRKFGLDAEPGEGFVDALLEGDFGLAEDGVGSLHRGHVVGDHAAVSG